MQHDAWQLMEEAKRDLRMRGGGVFELLKLVETWPRVADHASYESEFARFHHLAGRLPDWQDYDFGALVLEAYGDQLPTSELKQYCYRHALYRARWLASAASSAGEGMARIQHAEILEKKMV